MTKGVEPDELAKAIRTVAAGGSYLLDADLPLTPGELVARHGGVDDAGTVGLPGPGGRWEL